MLESNIQNIHIWKFFLLTYKNLYANCNVSAPFETNSGNFVRVAIVANLDPGVFSSEIEDFLLIKKLLTKSEKNECPSRRDQMPPMASTASFYFIYWIFKNINYRISTMRTECVT